MKFFVEVQKGQLVAQGRVGAQVSPDHFFVRYDAPQKYGRMVSLTIMENFALFDTEEELAQFAAAQAPSVPTGTSEKNYGAAVDMSKPSSAQ